MSSDEVRSQEWIDTIEELVRRAESLPDPSARSVAVDLLQAVLSFHAAGIERMLAIVAEEGSAGQAILEQIATDDLTGSLLLLHDLHPHDLETRVTRAVSRLGEVFISLGAKLSLIAIETPVVRLHFESARSWSGTPVRASVENAILQAAPEIETVVIEGLKETPAPGFVPLTELFTSPGA